MEVQTLSLHMFPLNPGQEFDPSERYAFWNNATTIEWFKIRGYTLYEWLGEGNSRPKVPFEPSQDANHPWPYYDTDEYPYSSTTPAEPLMAEDSTGKVVYAQDSLNRHVVIKPVRANTDEYRILKFLNEQDLKILKENSMIPVLELLPIEGYWFAVMPRWGTEIYLPNIWNLSDALHIIRSMLKGVVFLHNHNISHGDLELRNILVNHFSDYRTAIYNYRRSSLRYEQRLSYALFDFDHSTMFPPNASRSELRLPYQKSWGTFNWTGDTDAGEYEFDPFALDVGTMGCALRGRFTGFIPLFPGLAPLFDMMMNWDVRHRFTASQALEFFESRVSELTEDPSKIMITTFEQLNAGNLDVWEGLSPDFVEKWKMYRALPKPWSRRLLSWITDKGWMCHVVPWTRWLANQVFLALPCRIYSWFLLPKLTSRNL